MNQFGVLQPVNYLGQVVKLSPRLPTEGSMPAGSRTAPAPTHPVEIRAHGAAHTLTNNAPSKHINHECHAHQPCQVET